MASHGPSLAVRRYSVAWISSLILLGVSLLRDTCVHACNGLPRVRLTLPVHQFLSFCAFIDSYSLVRRLVRCSWFVPLSTFLSHSLSLSLGLSLVGLPLLHFFVWSPGYLGVSVYPYIYLFLHFNYLLLFLTHVGLARLFLSARLYYYINITFLSCLPWSFVLVSLSVYVSFLFRHEPRGVL